MNVTLHGDLKIILDSVENNFQGTPLSSSSFIDTNIGFVKVIIVQPINDVPW
jgi:hypothetical protein